MPRTATLFIRSTFAMAGVSLGLATLVASPAAAAPLYWDTSDVTGLQGGAGTWSTGAVGWNSASDGTTLPRVVWTAGSDAFFDATDVSSYTVTATGTPSFGDLTFNAGSVTVSGGIAWGTANKSITVNSGAGATSLGAISGTVTGTSNITNNGTGALSVTSISRGTSQNTSLVFGGGSDITLGALSNIGTGNITKNGAGTLQINSRGNAVNQLIAITGGTLFFNSAGTGGNALTGSTAANAVTISNNAVLRTVTRTGVGGAASGIRLGNTAGGTLQVEGANTFTVDGIISEASAGSQLTKTGTGKVILANVNTYTGLTTVSNGTLEHGVDNALSTGGVTVNGASAVLDLKTFNDTVGTVTLDGGGQINSSTGVLTSTGTFEMKSGSASAILAGGGIALNKTTGGTVTLSGANTYTGLTTVSAGTLKAGVASVANTSVAFGNNSAVSLANVSGAAIDLNGFDTQIGSLTGGGAAGGNVILGNKAITIGGDNTSPAAYGGTISGTGGTLTKIGSGTLTFSGTNTYTGGTTVSAGTLLVTSTGSLASVVTVGDGGAYQKQISSGTMAGILSVSGVSASAGGAGTATIVASNAVAGLTTVTMDWRTRAAGELPATRTTPPLPATAYGLISDVVDLTTAGYTATGDVFVFEMAYNPALITGVTPYNPGGASIAALAANGNIYLAWLSGGIWQNAINGNNYSLGGSSRTTPVLGAAPTSFVTSDLGTWGVDTSTSKVWAVINHNSEFAVVPEPGTIALLGLGAAALLRRRKSAKKA